MSTQSQLLGVAVAALLAAAAAASCANGAAVTSLDCTSSQTACDTVCADLQSDTENCGKCGVVCGPAQVCVKGVCAIECPFGDSLCGGGDGGKSGRCVNTRSDNANCGTCSHSCKTGEICFQGNCTSTCGSAQLGQTVCTADGGASFCANLKNDNQNCGKCGTTCSSEQVCVSGACQSDCTMDQTMCGGDGGPLYCADLQSDNANCGACGAACGVLQACSGGQCFSQCNESQTICTADGGAPFCADTYSDNTNCGSCGTVCPSAKPVCSGGTCSDGSCNRTALVLGDGVSASNTAYQTLLQGVGFTVTLQSSGTTTYTGSPAASSFGVVIVTPGNTYSTDMPSAGQTAIVNAQSSGAGMGVVFTEFFAYLVGNGQYATLKSLLLFPRTTGIAQALQFTVVASGHPIWNGLPSVFNTGYMLASTAPAPTASGAIEIAKCTASTCSSGVGVAAKDPSGAGRIVQIGHSAAYSGNAAWYSDTNLSKLLTNSALWAARCN